MTRISTHVLDSGSGQAVNGMEITLFSIVKGQHIELTSGVTGDDGRIENMATADGMLMHGTYCLHFATGKYFARDRVPVFYPYVEVVFNIDGKQSSYHIPLVFSPFGYSTYMGS